MEILKIYNNNVVSCLDSKGREMIVTGAGIGFKKKPGQKVDVKRITQQFYLESKQIKRIEKLLDRYPAEYFLTSELIFKAAEKKLGRKFDPAIYIPFTDHLAAAIERAKKNIPLPNLTLMEIKTIWKDEFEFSLRILKVIEKKFNVKMSVDEAGYFAVYFVTDTEENKAVKSIELVQMVADIIRIIECCYGVRLNKNSLSYMRLVTHLRFFIGRIKNNETREEKVNKEIYDILIKNNVKLLKCRNAILKYIKDELNYEVSQAEIIYLMIHITQIMGS